MHKTMGMDQELYRFRAIIGHQGPLLASDPDWKGSKYNVQVEWETGEITFEPLSIIAADDPVFCAAYAKENDLLALEGWHRFRSLAKKQENAQDHNMGMDQELYRFRAIIGHQGPCMYQIQIGKEGNIMFKLNGRLGRLLLNPSPSLLLMIQSFVQHMPKKMIYML